MKIGQKKTFNNSYTKGFYQSSDDRIRIKDG